MESRWQTKVRKDCEPIYFGHIWMTRSTINNSSMLAINRNAGENFSSVCASSMASCKNDDSSVPSDVSSNELKKTLNSPLSLSPISREHSILLRVSEQVREGSNVRLPLLVNPIFVFHFVNCKCFSTNTMIFHWKRFVLSLASAIDLLRTVRSRISSVNATTVVVWRMTKIAVCFSRCSRCASTSMSWPKRNISKCGKRENVFFMRGWVSYTWKKNWDKQDELSGRCHGTSWKEN